MDLQKVHAMLAEGRRHLHYLMGLLRIQLDHGRHVLHEHPDWAIDDLCWSVRCDSGKDIVRVIMNEWLILIRFGTSEENSDN